MCRWGGTRNGSGHRSRTFSNSCCHFYQKKPSLTVLLHQYDGSTIPVKGEIKETISTGEQSITGNFTIADIHNDQLPLLLAIAVATALAQLFPLSFSP